MAKETPVYERLTVGTENNGRNFSGGCARKTRGLLQLHTFGLLNDSFRPAEEICVLRAFWRQRAEYVAAASACTQHMQKVLTEMNVQLANVISDISGVTGICPTP